MTEDVEVRAPMAIISAGGYGAELAAYVDALEARGQPVTLICLDRSRHDHNKTSADVFHLPLFSPGIAASSVSRLIRDPARVVRSSAGLFTRPLRIPAAIHIARMLSGRGIAVAQGFDTVATKIAAVVNDLLDAPPPDVTSLAVDWSRIGAQRAGIRWFSRRINSVAAEVSLQDGRRLVIKRSGRAAHENQILRILGHALSKSLTVPRILDFDEHASVLVMERAPGTTLETLYGLAGADAAAIEHLTAAIQGAGKWIAAMQAATRRTGDGREIVATVVAAAIDDAGMVAATDGFMRRKHAKILEGLRTLHQRVSGRSLRVTGHHGDYFPGNVFFDGERVTAIDFESFREGLPLEDVAYFMMRSEMLVRRFRLPAQLTQRFLDAYSPDEKPDRDALRLFTMTRGLRTLANQLGYDQPLPQRIWARRTIGKLVLRAIPDRS